MPNAVGNVAPFRAGGMSFLPLSSLFSPTLKRDLAAIDHATSFLPIPRGVERKSTPFHSSSPHGSEFLVIKVNFLSALDGQIRFNDNFNGSRIREMVENFF